MISIRKKVLSFFLILASTLSYYAQEPKFDQLGEFLTILSNNDKMMGSLNVTKNNEDIFSRSSGYLDISKKMSNNSDTRFRIGSVTKTFTAVMIFQLIDENKLKLNTPLARFFPKIPNAANIKISNLLNHSSGLFNITSDADFSNWMIQPSSQKLMVSRISSYKVVEPNIAIPIIYF
jgi:CubicO group peptidase (beta-lactamase class C family)